jgi:hypothetical protein
VQAPASSREPLIDPFLPDWRDESAYLSLVGADPSAFAWEWLRRTPAYQANWRSERASPEDRRLIARRFGLEDLENPSNAIPWARPVWSRAVLGSVLTAHVADIRAPRSERVDLRLLAPLVTIVIGHNETEHVLFSDGRRFLRVDVVEGTLIGCPSSLTYLLRGLTRLQGPIGSLDRLARLVRARSFEEEKPTASMRQHRWIQELRVADALSIGCDQQSIARGMFGSLVPETRWRVDSPSVRRQVQRLVATARLRMNQNVEAWFS